MQLEFLDRVDPRAASLDAPDVYYAPSYGWSAELVDEGRWECAVSGDGALFLPYIRREIELPGSSGEYDIVSPYGYAGIGGVQGASDAALDEFRTSFLREGRARGLVAEFLRTNPLDIPAKDSLDRLRADSTESHRTYLVRGGSSPDEYWDQCEGRHRTAVRKAQRLRIEVLCRPRDDVLSAGSGFRTVYDQTMERVRAGRRLRLSDEYYRRLLEGVGHGIHVVEARRGDEVLAAAIFMSWGRRLHYHLSGSTPEGLSAGATNLLIDWAVRRLLQPDGALHLGGGLQIGDGLDKFKRSVSTEECSVFFCRTVVNPDRYTALTNRVGSPATDYFPAYRQ